MRTLHLLLHLVAVLVVGCSLAFDADRYEYDNTHQEGGIIDAGRDSAIPLDTGSSCEAGSTECGGECVDLDNSPAHCGECSRACMAPPGMVATCAERDCVFECAPGRGDCNETLDDGCEVDADADALHCGGCEFACDAALTCRGGTCRPRATWANGLGNVGGGNLSGVVLDADGNVYLAGNFAGTLTFGATTLTAEGTLDAYVVSYTSSGVPRWALRTDGLIDAIAADPSGNIYVAGGFEGTSSFGGPALVSAGGADVFVASYTPSGAFRWSVRGGGANDEAVSGIGVDLTGNLYVTGTFSGTASFGAGALTSDGGSADVFVTSYSSGGLPRWSLRGGGSGADSANAIAADPSGQVYVVGRFQASASFGGSLLTSEGTSDLFVASYTSSGLHRWSIREGGASAAANAVAADATGSVYVTGAFQGSATFGGAALVSEGQDDLFLVSYTTDGAHRWSLRGGGAGKDVASDVAADASGLVHITGRFTNLASFGGPELASAGADDVFVASYSATDGAHQASLRFGAVRSDVGTTLATHGGALCASGSFQDTVTIGDQTLIAAVGSDRFVACFEL